MQGIIQSNRRLPDATYHVREVQNVPVLVIVDLDRGGPSVTNTVEALIEEIQLREGTEFKHYPVIYCDSQGNYDGINTAEGPPFYPLATSEELAAADKAAQRWHLDYDLPF